MPKTIAQYPEIESLGSIGIHFGHSGGPGTSQEPKFPRPEPDATTLPYGPCRCGAPREEAKALGPLSQTAMLGYQDELLSLVIPYQDPNKGDYGPSIGRPGAADLQSSPPL